MTGQLPKCVLLGAASIFVISSAPAFAESTCDLNGVPGVPAGGAYAFQCGNVAIANGQQATAIGDGANAAGDYSVALGDGAGALGDGSTSIGAQSGVQGSFGTALGTGAQVTAANGTALGSNSEARGANSVALGADSIADQANSVSVGIVGGERKIVNVAAGAADTHAVNMSQLNATNQQLSAMGLEIDDLQTDVASVSGQVSAQGVQVAANTAAISAQGGAIGDLQTDVSSINSQVSAQGAQIGTLQTDVAANTAAISAQGAQIGAMQTTLGDHESRIGALEQMASGIESLQARVDSLFDLRKKDRRDMKQGIAGAIAMADAPMPSKPGGVSYAFKAAAFRGENAVGGSVSYRLDTGSPMAVTAGFSYGGNRNNAASVGVSGEF